MVIYAAVYHSSSLDNGASEVGIGSVVKRCRNGSGRLNIITNVNDKCRQIDLHIVFYSSVQCVTMLSSLFL